MVLDYSKWNKPIEVSDDEDDTHPNIDTPSLNRWRHEARVGRMEESDQEWMEFHASKADLQRRQKELESRREAGKDVTESARKLHVLEQGLRDREQELNKKARLTPWNVDTIATQGFSKTTINRMEKGEDKAMTEDEKAQRFIDFTKENDKLVEKFGMLRRYEDSKKFLSEHPHLACEDTANYLVYWCIDLAIDQKLQLVDHVSHQCIAIQFLLLLAKQLDRDPRECVSPFFSKIAHLEQKDYKDAFDTELRLFQIRIRKRAEEKIAKAMKEERDERLGPGGLDPVEVMESLPEELKSCFEKRDIPLLQKVISEMSSEKASFYIQQCIDSGLWVPPEPNPQDMDGNTDEAIQKNTDEVILTDEEKETLEPDQPTSDQNTNTIVQTLQRTWNLLSSTFATLCGNLWKFMQMMIFGRPSRTTMEQ